MIYNSFEKVYEAYFDKIYNYIFEQMLNREIAEDLTEDVFVKVLNNLDSYNPSRGGGIINVDLYYRSECYYGLSAESLREPRKCHR